MKAVLLLPAVISCLLGGTSALAEVTCEECTSATADLIERLLSEDSIAEQIAIVGAVVCPATEDPAGCEAYLAAWWEDAADCLFNFIAASNPCASLGVCARAPGAPVRSWTCEECEDILGRLAAYLESEETVAAGVELLQGDCFCGAEGHTADCPDIIGSLVPKAMPVLASVLTEQTTELCQDIAGVC